MELLIDETQKKFQSMTLNTYESYEKTVFPLLKPIIQLLVNEKVFPKIVNINQGIDVYVDSLMLILNGEYNNHLPKNVFNYRLAYDSVLPIYCIVYVLIKHPYFINIISSNLTREEWVKYKQELLEELMINYGETSGDPRIIRLRNILEIDTFKDTNFSALHQFRYLIGFSFKEEFTGITYDQLPMDKSLLIINLSYNNNKPESLVVYKNIQTNRRVLLLNDRNMYRYKPFILPETTIKTDEPYKLITKESSDTMVVLCYNNDTEMTKCFYSIAYFDGTQDGTIPNTFVERFINGASPFILQSEDIDNYVKDNTFKHFNEKTKDPNILLRENNIYAQIASESYDEDHNDVSKTIQNILNHELLDSLMNKSELEIFKTYVYGLKILSTFNKTTVIEHIVSYNVSD